LSVLESTEVGTVLAPLSAGGFAAADADAGPACCLYFLVAGNDDGAFTLREDTAELSVGRALDFETASVRRLIIAASDGVHEVQLEVVVTVTDAVEPPVVSGVSAVTIGTTWMVGASLALEDGQGVDVLASLEVGLPLSGDVNPFTGATCFDDLAVASKLQQVCGVTGGAFIDLQSDATFINMGSQPEPYGLAAYDGLDDYASVSAAVVGAVTAPSPTAAIGAAHGFVMAVWVRQTKDSTGYLFSKSADDFTRYLALQSNTRAKQVGGVRHRAPACP